MDRLQKDYTTLYLCAKEIIFSVSSERSLHP